MTFSTEQARALLNAADVFYSADDEFPDEAQTLNLNDVWGWATGWGEYVPDDKLPEVARLFCNYGWPGVFYWVSEQHQQMRSEFADINRFIDFVRAEEKLRLDEPDSTTRAYKKVKYTIGVEP